jgi:hypothetical protein
VGVIVRQDNTKAKKDSLQHVAIVEKDVVHPPGVELRDG